MDMNQMMHQARKMQEQLQAAQAEAAAAEVEGTAGGGMVAVTASGDATIKAIKIKPEVVDPDDIETLEDLVLAAVNDAMDKAHQLSADKMGGITGGLNIPGF
jgi:DNA-binding YbaB/EbfC family protein